MTEVRRYDYRRVERPAPGGWTRGELALLVFLGVFAGLGVWGALWVAPEVLSWFEGEPGPTHADAPNIDP